MTLCPRCGNQASYVQQYGQWYCSSCQNYLLVTPPPPVQPHQYQQPAAQHQYQQPAYYQPPPAEPRGIGLMITGTILLIIGIIFVAAMLTMITNDPEADTISPEELTTKRYNGESGTFKVMQEMTQEEWDSLPPISQEVYATMGIDGPGKYIYTVELVDGMPINFPHYEKYEEPSLILGIIGVTIGIVLLLVGLILISRGYKKGHKTSPANPPFQQP